MAAKNKKGFMDDVDPINDGYQKAEAVRPTLEQVDREIYGGPAIQEGERQVARPIALDQITPDPAQPRQAIPLSIRKAAKESGDPEWMVWHRVAESQHGSEIDLSPLLRGEGDGAESDPLGIPLVDDFMALVGLGASIYRDGLANAITVQARGDRYEIETGERRYQAYKMLYGVLKDEKFNKIAARVVAKADVWRQAAENGSRKPLNAIGMGRQLALLIMDLWRGRDGANFVPYGKMIQEGDIDRKFYAQVADGNIWRIPKGASERILQVTGLKSKGQLHQYRLLLNVPDDVWTKADEENWAEGKIREHMASLRPAQDRSTTVDLSSQNTAPLLNQTVTHKVRYMGRIVGFIRLDENGTARIQHYSLNGDPSYQQSVRPEELRDLPTPGQFPTQSPFNRETPATISTAIKVDAGIIPRPEQDLFKQIFQHKSGRLYQITGTMPNNQVMAFQVDQDGNRKGKLTEPLDRADLFAKPTAPEFNPEQAMADILDDEEEASTEDTLPSSGSELDRDGTPLPEWVKVGARAYAAANSNNPAYEGVIISVHMGGGQVWGAVLDIGRTNVPVSVKDLAPALPDWAKMGRMVRDVSTDETGKVKGGRWSETAQDWYLIVQFLETSSEVPLAMLEANDPVPVLPDWVKVDHLVRHTGSGKVCQVLSAGFNVTEDAWMLHVDVYKEGIADAPLSEFEPMDQAEAQALPQTPAAPRERHPALHPSNMNGVISQEQHDLGSLRKMAEALKMLQLADMIMAFHILTAQALRTRLRQSSRDQVQAWLDTLYRACMDVLQQMVQRVDAAYANATQVLDDIDAEQRDQNG